jgi:LPS O-antigen subunit length determinant protein (WzzB/FepE family)
MPSVKNIRKWLVTFWNKHWAIIVAIIAGLIIGNFVMKYLLK